MTLTLRVNPIACTGHGICAEVAPELIEPDEWGYPILGSGPVPARLEREAREAVAACPVLALKLQPAKLDGPGGTVPPATRQARNNGDLNPAVLTPGVPTTGKAARALLRPVAWSSKRAMTMPPLDLGMAIRLPP
jgi:ferredoxin